MEIMTKKKTYQQPVINVIRMEVEGVIASSNRPSTSKDPSGLGGFDHINNSFWEDF